MSKRLIDITGNKYNKLTVVSLASTIGEKTQWTCKCECGNYRIVYPGNLKNGTTKSCGCYQKQKASEVNTSHGLTITNRRLYGIWQNMISRCYNTKNKGFNRYGLRGIMVCDEWKDVNLFFQWALENGYSSQLTIDRKDNDGNYTPQNCRWVTIKDQLQNTSRTIGLQKVVGKKKDLKLGLSVKNLADKHMVSPSAVYQIRKGTRYSNIVL